MYEGEWIEDSPRCGEFRDPTDAEVASMGDSSVFKHPFALPALDLKDSRAVLDCTVAATRLESSIKEGVANSGIDSDKLIAAERAFAELDSSGLGAVEASYLGSVFSKLGVYITPDDLSYVMRQFQLEDVTDLSFPEVVEIASFLLENR